MGDGWIEHACRLPSPAHYQRALLRQSQLTKPLGALGRLENIAVDLAALQSRDRPCARHVPIIVFAGDHGVVAHGVSAYPAEVTVQMLHNFASGGAAISVLARELDVPLRLVDAGTLSSTPIAGVHVDKPCLGSHDFSTGAAMSLAELAHALAAGRRAVEAVLAETNTRPDLLVLGEMGIGNSTAASALACAVDGLPCIELVGAGSGLDEERIAHKRRLIEMALTLHRPSIAAAATPALEALRRLGGLEIAAVTGAMIAAAQHGIGVLVDGFIVSVAALVAVRINPAARAWMLFSHRSAERGHAQVLRSLEAEPLLQLELRLGEGSGAALAIPLLRMACALHNDMATFAEADVSNRKATP